MGISGDEGDACRGVDGSVISTIPHHLPISFSYIYIKMKSRQENKILNLASPGYGKHPLFPGFAYVLLPKNAVGQSPCCLIISSISRMRRMVSFRATTIFW